MSCPKLKMSIYKWITLQSYLRKSGGGDSESGAFLLGKKHSKKIINYIGYKELDSYCQENGLIDFDGKGYVQLWEYCEKENLVVLADVHTHPNEWTRQSKLDRTNPMIAQKGHIALIIPNYAKKLQLSLKGVGIYLYKGDHRWVDLTSKLNSIKLTFL